MTYMIKQIIASENDRTIFDIHAQSDPAHPGKANPLLNAEVYALGVQGERWTKFKINGTNVIQLGPSEIYEIEFDPDNERMFLTSVQAVDVKGHNMIFDIKYRIQ